MIMLQIIHAEEGSITCNERKFEQTKKKKTNPNPALKRLLMDEQKWITELK